MSRSVYDQSLLIALLVNHYGSIMDLGYWSGHHGVLVE